MAAALYNMARMTTATTGTTDPLVLGSAVSSFLTFANAGVPDGAVVSYVIEDGSSREKGLGVYTSSGTTLTRNVTNSTDGGTTKITLSGTAQVAISPGAADLLTTPNLHAALGGL